MTLLWGRKAWAETAFWDRPDVDLGRGTWSLDGPGREKLPHDFGTFVSGALKRSGPVAACVAARQFVFSQAVFRWLPEQQQGEPFGDRSLSLLERPWPGGTTASLLSRMELDGQLAGAAYVTRADDRGRVGNAARGGPGERLVRLRPDWVTLVIDSSTGDPYAADARLVALEYLPRGVQTRMVEPLLLLVDEVGRYVPQPDPDAAWRGMSWISTVLEEIDADKAATRHKGAFLRRGASPRMTVSLPRETTREQLDRFRSMMEAQHGSGAGDAYRTLFLTGGADVKVVGADLRQIDFKATQGAGETRIAMAARVPPVIAGMSEGLQGSSLNQGNFAAARRLMADGLMVALWAEAAAALQQLVPPPREGVRLWADTRRIPFLREDAKDLAEIQAVQARALRTLTDAGWTPDAAAAFIAGDTQALRGAHSGLFSVQLQAPGTTLPGGSQRGQDDNSEGVAG